MKWLDMKFNEIMDEIEQNIYDIELPDIKVETTGIGWYEYGEITAFDEGETIIKFDKDNSSIIIDSICISERLLDKLYHRLEKEILELEYITFLGMKYYFDDVLLEALPEGLHINLRFNNVEPEDYEDEYDDVENF